MEQELNESKAELKELKAELIIYDNAIKVCKEEEERAMLFEEKEQLISDIAEVEDEIKLLEEIMANNKDNTNPEKLNKGMSELLEQTHFPISHEEAIARVCHATNKSWCEMNGDFTQKDWNDAEDWQKQSAIKGVEFRLNNPDAGHDAQHNSWMAEKLQQGWVYGEVKNAEKKTHPCIVSFEKLPLFQQKKDALF
ncbi:MAG: RyR domain-containing protein, partial [Flavobacterium sp.]